MDQAVFMLMLTFWESIDTVILQYGVTTGSPYLPTALPSDLFTHAHIRCDSMAPMSNSFQRAGTYVLVYQPTENTIDAKGVHTWKTAE